MVAGLGALVYALRRGASSASAPLPRANYVLGFALACVVVAACGLWLTTKSAEQIAQLGATRLGSWSLDSSRFAMANYGITVLQMLAALFWTWLRWARSEKRD